MRLLSRRVIRKLVKLRHQGSRKRRRPVDDEAEIINLDMLNDLLDTAQEVPVWTSSSTYFKFLSQSSQMSPVNLTHIFQISAVASFNFRSKNGLRRWLQHPYKVAWKFLFAVELCVACCSLVVVAWYTVSVSCTYYPVVILSVSFPSWYAAESTCMTCSKQWD